MKVYTTGQVAKLCNVANRTVSKWFDSGGLLGYRVPGSRDRRIPSTYLERFLREHDVPVPQEVIDANVTECQHIPAPKETTLTKDLLAQDIERLGNVQCSPLINKAHLIPKSILEMLAETSMVEHHEDNGPGHYACPVCCACETMLWKNGRQVNSTADITHHNDCPVIWAQERV